MSYRVTFERIGRSHHGHVETFHSGDDDLAASIYRFARPHLRSRDVEVAWDPETGREMR